jgi:hypothetical protein
LGVWACGRTASLLDALADDKIAKLMIGSEQANEVLLEETATGFAGCGCATELEPKSRPHARGMVGRGLREAPLQRGQARQLEPQLRQMEQETAEFSNSAVY